MGSSATPNAMRKFSIDKSLIQQSCKKFGHWSRQFSNLPHRDSTYTLLEGRTGSKSSQSTRKRNSKYRCFFFHDIFVWPNHHVVFLFFMCQRCILSFFCAQGFFLFVRASNGPSERVCNLIIEQDGWERPKGKRNVHKRFGRVGFVVPTTCRLLESFCCLLLINS